jgi:hypothetical protein
MLKADTSATLFKPPYLGAIKQSCSCSLITRPKSMLKADIIVILLKLLYVKAIKQSYSSFSITRPKLILKAESLATLFKLLYISAARIANKTFSGDLMILYNHINSNQLNIILVVLLVEQVLSHERDLILEGDLLKLAKKKGITGIIEWFYYKQITIDRNPYIIVYFRRDMKFRALRKLSSKAS